MMTIEKKLQLTDLSQYDLRALSRSIVKYQLFKVKSALHKLEGNFAPTTKFQYFKVGVQYLKTGCKKDKVNPKLYDYLDECLSAHIQPLTPSLKDKAREYNRKKEQKVTPVFNLPQQVTEKFEYAVRNGNQIMVFDNEEQIKRFINNLNSLMIAHNCKPVSVIVGDLK